MKEGQVSYVASIDKASIVVTLLLSFLILREPVTPKILLGAGFILTGVSGYQTYEQRRGNRIGNGRFEEI